ncbi:General substrate transporter [Elaphomyces granulatus]
MGHNLGLTRASYIVSVSCFGSFAFAFDTGVISMSSVTTKYLQHGQTVLFLIVGTILQVVNSHTLGTFYVGRVVAGVGIGAATVLIPMYSAEMAPKEIRGKLGACFQLFFATGVMVAYWVTYAVSVDQPSVTKQWQIPLGLQLLPSSLLFIESLKWVRGGDETEELQTEFDEILAGIEEEARIKENFTPRELLLPANRYRIFIAITIQLCAQLTGNTSLAYYAAQIFSAVGAGDSSMFVTGFFGVVKVVGVLIFQLFVLDRIGRRTPFMVGAAAMGSFMLIIACIVATHEPSATATQQGATGAGIAAVIMIYAEAFSFNMSWGPLTWLYLGEIFSNRTREIGIAIGAASQWLFNFVMSQMTPHAIANIGWRTFLIFAIFNYAIIIYSWMFLKETAGHSLEEMQAIFGGQVSNHDNNKDPDAAGRQEVSTGV